MLSIMNWCAWGLSGVLAIWMLWDLLKTNRSHSEDYLTSSAEGEIIDAEMAETAARQ